MSEDNNNTDVVFSSEALAEYEEILTHYPERRAALMPVLWLAQREFGWLSPATQKYVASLMELPQSWVEGVASFYTMYWKKPVGKTHLQVCTGPSCYLRGADDIVSAISKRMDISPGGTTLDGACSLERAECLGSCDSAPMMQISNDRYVENLTVDQVLELLKRVQRGEEV
ncbi:MAG: NADH-quinone oxidoreductase E subunit [Hyphomicrobiaceae bacterium]|jgi:NADH-quinone oxidoreductase E subunit